MIDWYILDPVDHRVIPCQDIELYIAWKKEHDIHHVAETVIGDEWLWVSTVFLGLNHRCNAYGPPVVFETMVFEREESVADLGGLGPIHYSYSFESFSRRYCTWDEAAAGHIEVVDEVNKTDRKRLRVHEEGL